MKTKLTFIYIFLMLAMNSWADEGKINIVATQTIFADLVKEVGGDHVNVEVIASPKFNVHFIQPKPSDVRKVSRADLYVNAGLDLEVWSDPLLEAAGKPQLFRNGPRNVDLSQKIKLLNPPQGEVTRADGDIHLFGNPHFHMNPENAYKMVATLLEKIKTVDPTRADEYEQKANAFKARLAEKIREWKSVCAHCQGHEILSYHNDVVYFADFLGIRSNKFLQPKPGIPPTAKHLEFLSDYVKKNNVKVIVLPTYYSKAEANKIASKLGVKVVTIAQGVGEVEGTNSFFKFFDFNIKQISEALKS